MLAKAVTVPKLPLLCELVLAVGKIADNTPPGVGTLNPIHTVAPTGDPAAKKTV
jgi:hypothetical protein